MQIVIAWAEKTKIVPTTGFISRDANLFPSMRLDWEARAAMWARKGDESDLSKAKSFADREGYTVYTYSINEKHPLDKARQEALKNARNSDDNFAK